MRRRLEAGRPATAQAGEQVHGKAAVSSRTTREAAGWACLGAADLTGLLPPEWRPKRFWWIDPRPLWRSRNDKIARIWGDPTGEERRRWTEAMRRAGAPPDLRIRRFERKAAAAFVVLGDTGEGDRSQYHVVPPLRATSEGTDFLFLCSDVVYPAGDVHEYDTKFYWPYRWFEGPIYAVPGNHDWYDGLQGFMRHFCGARPEQRPPARPVGTRGQRLLRALTWRRPKPADEERIRRMRELRPRPEQQAEQPGPYFAVDAGPVLLVGLDTGIVGGVDAAQARWLLEISRVDKPKILLTGKPLYVDGRPRQTLLEGFGPLGDVVTDPAHQYLAVIGGDIHNYQRYPIALPDGRTIQFIVGGGGGAYTHATHRIPKVELDGCSEADFRCYPRRGDSLAVYSILYDNRLRWVRNFGRRGKFVVPPEQAARIIGRKLGLEPTRPEDRDVPIDEKALRAADAIMAMRGRVTGVFHHYFSEFLDWDEPPPPLFKSFIRVEVVEGQVDFFCFAATGCAEHEDKLVVEDWVRGTRQDDGRWAWEVRS